jgi:hypothetical protein
MKLYDTNGSAKMLPRGLQSFLRWPYMLVTKNNCGGCAMTQAYRALQASIKPPHNRYNPIIPLDTRSKQSLYPTTPQENQS